MAPPLQAISILHHLLLAASMVVMVSSSAELAEPPSGHRFQLIRLSPTAVPAPMRYFHLDYLMEFYIGDSLVSGIADTGSDLIWTNNSQLIDSPTRCPCDTVKENSDCCHGLCCHGLCMFERKYAGGSVATGFMGKAKLNFKESNYITPDPLDIGFAVLLGCNLSNVEGKACKPYRAGGIVGLGLGKLSLVKQLGLHSFSYCLPDYRKPQLTGQIELNHTAMLPEKGTQETKLVKIDKYPSRYYVEVMSIEVKNNGGPLEIPNGCFQNGRSNGDGGMFIDSGTSFTHLPKETLDKVKKLVKDLMEKRDRKENEKSKNTGFTCYHGAELPENMPEMVLHFKGGAKLAIPVESYMYPDEQNKEVCLAIRNSELHASQHMSILGNFQQQNIHMLFNLTGSGSVSFVKRTCGEKKHAAV